MQNSHLFGPTPRKLDFLKVQFLDVSGIRAYGNLIVTVDFISHKGGSNDFNCVKCPCTFCLNHFFQKKVCVPRTKSQNRGGGETGSMYVQS